MQLQLLKMDSAVLVRVITAILPVTITVPPGTTAIASVAVKLQRTDMLELPELGHARSHNGRGSTPARTTTVQTIDCSRSTITTSRESEPTITIKIFL